MEQSTSEVIKSDGNCKDVRQLLSLQNQKPLVFLGVIRRIWDTTEHHG
jgi:hypothetical protein